MRRPCLRALKSLAEMTLTVVDGDFPREVLSKTEPDLRQNTKCLRSAITGSAYDAHFKMSHAEKKKLDADVAP